MDFYLFRSPHLVCGEQIVVFNGYDLNHHYETKHTEKYQNLIDMELEKLLMRLHFLLRFTPPLMELSCHSLLRDY